jgi:hypothetical protein
LLNSRAAPRAFMQHRRRRRVSINNAAGLVLRYRWQAGISVLSRTTPSLESRQFSQEKKLQNIPVPSRPAPKSPGGFSEGVWSGSSAAVRPAALSHAYWGLNLLSKYRPSLCTAVSRLGGRGGAVVSDILRFSLICRFRWYSVHCDDGASLGR